MQKPSFPVDATSTPNKNNPSPQPTGGTPNQSLTSSPLTQIIPAYPPSPLTTALISPSTTLANSTSPALLQPLPATPTATQTSEIPLYLQASEANATVQTPSQLDFQFPITSQSPVTSVLPTTPTIIPTPLSPSTISPQNTDKTIARQITSQCTATGGNYIDITPYLNLPQKQAALKLGIPTSTLSKRWKEAVCGRKWPYRSVCKLDKEILTLLQNIQPGEPLSPEVETALTRLLKKRKEELRTVVIRV
eukprot:TRINITY_DN6238_c0_g1_i1.p1 TRINITY_DN6238_c0_g1~~TRINITY_DN6238_c0_g1_i1.p1  ORF type:complete len:249 (-),score=44.40 TRINITY_DN6238_c0_g1_i1:32-778(-)